MNVLKTICINLVWLLFSIIGTANANTVLYEISGNLAGAFQPVSGDPIADLLNVSRNSINNVPFNLKLMIDTSNTPYVTNDNSILQEVIYRDAVINGELNLNGTKFETLRRPIPFLSATPPANNTPFDESRINILNRIAPTGSDFFRIRLGQNPEATSELFNNFTIPFNQTINGTFHDNAIVELNDIVFLIPNAPGLFDGIAIPVEGDAFNPLPILTGVNIFLSTDSGGFVQLINATDAGLGEDFTFSVTPVPVPAAIWFFISGLGLLRLVKRQRN